MTARFVSAELLFQFQNAAIELAQKLGAAEARIVELNEQVSMMKLLANHSFGKLGQPESVLYMPRQPGKSTMNSIHVIRELTTMVQQLTRPADPEGRGWQHPSLEYVKQCRERIKGLI